jgi:TetR/AcrR family transcriptional regulator, transcriptional repressor for nem operon
MVRYDKGHHDQTHAAIVEAASKLLREKGFTETSVGTVMKAVGLTHGGFYAHFQDKNAMLSAAVTEAFEQSPKNFTALVELATKSGDPGVVAKHYLSDSRVKNVASGCPAAALVSELPRQANAVQEAFQTGTIETMQALSATPGLSADADGSAWAALSMLVGGLTLMRACNNDGIDKTIRTQIINAMRALAAKPSES